MPGLARHADETVSVVIPVFNGAEFVADALRSVLAQTLAPLEIIVINDGSTDQTASVLAEFSGRITVVQQANRGLPATRNVGAQLARGTWLAFLDADDTWMPAKLERQMARALEVDAALIYTDRFNVGARGDLPDVQSAVQPLYEGDVFEDLLRGNHVTVTSVMVRREVFDALGGFNEQLRAAEDWDLWIRVAASYPVAAVHEPLVSYRFHSGMMSSDPRRMQKARWQVVRSGLDSLRGRRLSSAQRRQILAVTARSNAWDAVRHHCRRLALAEYGRAIAASPFDLDTYKDLLRMLVGRL